GPSDGGGMSSPSTILRAAGYPRFVGRRPGRMMVAMVLGTALSALGGEASAQTVNDLSRYCTACWRNARLPADCWTDCTQEVFTRLLERVPSQDWGGLLRVEGEERRELMRAIDAVKKRVQRGRKWSPYPPESVADHRPAADTMRAEQFEELRRAADEILSDRQRQILQRSIEGYTVQELAEQLGIGP